VSTAFGLGYAPVAPGTAGTLLGVAIYAAVAALCDATTQLYAIGLVFAVVCAASVPLATWAERHWGTKDPGRFVLDEVAGYLLVVLLFRSSSPVLTGAWAFAFSRLFDIVKPPPARRFERLSGGWGVLLDDLVASVYAAAALHLLATVAPSWVGSIAEAATIG
jgi:phosphatidylglycerophosphatase A